MPDPIEFYFEFSSPYGYFASYEIDDIAAEAGRTTKWKAFMLGVVFKLTGAQPLSRVPMKGEYSIHDWDRVGRMTKVDWVLPDPFPIATMNAARAFYWLDDRDPELAKQFARAAYHRYFGQGADITKAETVADVAEPLGVDRSALLEAMADPVMKQRLKDETDAAAERGVFGSPFVFVDGEPFWGVDRLPMVRDWLRTGGW